MVMLARFSVNHVIAFSRSAPFSIAVFMASSAAVFIFPALGFLDPSGSGGVLLSVDIFGFSSG